jgi:hypothetical protein
LDIVWKLLSQSLAGKADLIRDNKISMKELDAYVSETVPKLTGGAQHPIFRSFQECKK